MGKIKVMSDISRKINRECAYRAYDDKGILEILYDETPSNPLKENDCLGTVAWCDRHHSIGHEEYNDSDVFIHHLANEFLPEDTIQRLYKKEHGGDGCNYWLEDISSETLYEALTDIALFLPIYLHEHGGVTVECGSYVSDWDEGIDGWVYVTHDKLIDEYGDLSSETIRKAIEVINAEIEECAEYLEGNVFGFYLYKLTPVNEDEYEAEELDECVWGFYGTDWENNGIAEYIPEEYRHLIKELDTVY